MHNFVKTLICLLIAFETSSALHEGCVNQDWCTEVNTYCSTGGFCLCQAGFTEIKVGLYYECIKVPSPVSGRCSESIHCPVPATCEANSCNCPSETHAPSLNMTHCLEYATNLGAECKEPEVCSQIPNSECFSGYCLCQTGHAPNSDHSSCLKMAVRLSDTCVEDSQCQALLGSNATCADNRCFCKHGFTFNADRNQCYPIVDKVGGSCLINEQCVFHLGHAKCNVQGTCRCTQGYISTGSDCVLSK